MRGPLSVVRFERAFSSNPRNQTRVQQAAIGVISDLWTYPIKALAPVAHERVLVESTGLAGDRERALFVETPGHRRYGKTLRGKENALMHTASDVASGIALAERGGAAVRLSEPARYFDAAPVSLIFDTWLRECERRAGVAVQAERFRSNIVVRCEAGFRLAEADLVGMTIVIGDGTVCLRVVAAIERCVTPAYDLTTGETDTAILRAIAKDRGNRVGIYAEVVTPGTIARGNTVRLQM